MATARAIQPDGFSHTMSSPVHMRPHPMTSAERISYEDDQVARDPNRIQRYKSYLIITLVAFAGSLASTVTAIVRYVQTIRIECVVWIIYSAVFTGVSVLCVLFAWLFWAREKALLKRVQEWRNTTHQQRHIDPDRTRDSIWSRWIADPEGVSVERRTDIEQGAIELQDMYPRVNGDRRERSAGHGSRSWGDGNTAQDVVLKRTEATGGSAEPLSNLESPQISPLALNESNSLVFSGRNLSPVAEETPQVSTEIHLHRTGHLSISDRGSTSNNSPAEPSKVVSKFSAANIYRKDISSQDTTDQVVSDQNPLPNAHPESSAKVSEGNTGSRLTIIKRRGLKRLSVITLPTPVGSDDEDGQSSSGGTGGSDRSVKAEECSNENTSEGFGGIRPYSAT